MLFNSYTFLVFLLIVFFLYWRIRDLRAQNLLVVIASYIFYGWWDWRFLSLIIFSSTVDYFLGLKISQEEDPRRRKRWLWGSLLVNLGLLGTFKYFNFFVDSAAVLLESMGFQANMPALRILLPVGISFYTFQSLSYTIDVYRKQLEPTKNIITFFAFVSFFPQLVAGPIERASRLLPQFLVKRSFNVQQATDGMRQMLWGFFKKVVVADNCATIVDTCFNAGDTMNWWSLIVGVIFFAFQIYGDFSGYSDIAIGLARLFGFQLMRNFAYPYFSRDVIEFWRRWHISLSTWFRDYVFVPLGGSRGSLGKRIRNILITFTISGLWHGASWNFVFWGFLNGLYYVPYLIMNKAGKATSSIVAEHSFLLSVKETLQMLFTFVLICIAWVFFRSADMTKALEYFSGILSGDQGTSITSGNGHTLLVCVLALLVMIIFEWVQRRQVHALERLPRSVILRWAIYALIGLAVLNFFGTQKSFIYFQF